MNFFVLDNDDYFLSFTIWIGFDWTESQQFEIIMLILIK